MSGGQTTYEKNLRLQPAGKVRPTVLSCRDLKLVFDAGASPTVALNGVTLELTRGEFLCIVGPSGCGKTSLLKIVAGLLKPTAGDAVVEAGTGRRPLTPLVFQDHGLFPWRSVADNVAFGLEMAGVSRAQRRVQALEIIERVGLGGFADNLPHQLSVGMRQRVAIARALLCDSELLLMDEPFGALDAQTKIVLQEELLDWWRDRRQAVLYVTHDLEEAVALADRVLVMSARPGRVLAEVDVPLDRPRTIASRMSLDFQAIKAEIWDHLRDQLRAERRP